MENFILNEPTKGIDFSFFPISKQKKKNEKIQGKKGPHTGMENDKCKKIDGEKVFCEGMDWQSKKRVQRTPHMYEICSDLF